MIVAMQEPANEEQIQEVVEHLIKMGFSVHRTTGERQTMLGGGGSAHRFRYSQPGSAARGAGSPSHQRALQAGGAKLPSARARSSSLPNG